MNKQRFKKNIIFIKQTIIKSFFVIFSLFLLSCFFTDTKRENVIAKTTLYKAREAVENENFIEAFDLYNLLLFIDKTSKEGIFDLIKLYERFREYNKAIGLIINYKNVVPQDTDFDSMLAELYYRTEDYENALTYLGDGEISSLKKAICFEKRGDITEAESIYTALAPSFNEISGFLSTRIAYCQVAKGVPESIVDLFNKLGKIIKNEDEKYIVAGDLLDYFTKNEKYDEALRFISLMQKDFPERKNILELERANIYLALEDEEKAFELYQRILDDSEEAAYSAGIKLMNASKLLKKDYMKLAQLCYNRKDYSNARNLLEEYIKDSANNYALYLLGMSYYKLRQNKKVVQIFKKLKKRYPEKRETIIYYLGRAEEKIGDYKSAKKTYSAAGKDKKKKLAVNAIYLSALLEEDEGNFDSALVIYKDMKEVFEKGDYVYKAMLRGGILSYRMDSLSLAKKFFTKALDMSRKGRSNYVSSLYWLGRLEEKKGKTAKRDSLWSLIKKKTPLGFFSFYLGGNNLTTEEDNTKKWLSTWTDTVLSLTDDEKIYWYRGEVFLELGLAKEAEKSFSHINQTTIIAYTLAKLFKEKGFDYESILYSLKVKGRSPGSYFSKAPAELLKIEYPLLYLPTIIEKSRKYGVEPEIMVALIHQESAYQRNAVSVANAIGLTQLLPEVAEEVAKNFNIDYSGPEELKKKTELSIELGAAHFSELQNKFGKYEFSLAAYNAGAGKAKEWKRKWGDDFPTYFDMITYSETRGYVKRVLAKKEIYSLLWNLKHQDLKKDSTQINPER
ncbi:MAG: tetratricopeptide repeat protein [Candidatus Cloacimonadota bacterium]|nr:MAG: tetratricopeptide repeat protein [Candidatus Cloacimonadota bacterium]